MLIDKPLRRLKTLNTTACLWPYILKILKNKPAHAYILRQEIKKRFGFLPGQVTSYTTLYSLYKQGLVTYERKDRIKIYKITSKGRLELKKALEFYKETTKELS
jgi:DNA-binding PadR family transcriptional regulator